MKKLDLTRLLEDRVHLTGFDCAAIRALRNLQAVFGPGAMSAGTRIEFRQRSTTNPADVKCIDCWSENSAALRLWLAQKPRMSSPAFQREFAERRVVIHRRRSTLKSE